MALIVRDRILETCSTSGLVDFTLTGAVTGYQRFSAIGNGNTTYYTAYVIGGTEWEVGVGTVGTSSLTRDTILSCSTGSKINFSGNPVVWCDLPSSQALFTDTNGNTSLTSTSYTPSAQPTYLEGKVWYDSTSHALAYFNDSSNAIVHIGQDLQVKVINNTGSTIPNGSPVYITSTTSGQTYPNIALAKADVAATASVIGLTNGSIANGAIGYVTSQGGIDNVNTGTFTVGQVLYLSPYSAGQLMNTIPPTGITVQVGVVSYVNSSTGKIYVKQTTPLAVPASIITGTVAVANGGTGLSSTPANGQIDIGNGTGFTRTTLTAGANISITNASGAITIATTGAGAAVDQTDIGTRANQIPLNQYLGTMAWQDATAVQIAGGSTTNLVATSGYQIQPTTTTISAAGSTTLTVAQLLTYIVQVTQTAAVTLVLPTGTLTDAGILNGLSLVNTSFVWSVINTGTVLGAITISAGTGHTIVGSTLIAITTSAQFKTVKTATNTFVTYRIA